MTTTQLRAASETWTRHDVYVDERLRLALFEAGPKTAPPIVLVHGVGHWSQAAWDPIMRELAGDYRVIAFDLPGFGDSAKPDVRYDSRSTRACWRPSPTRSRCPGSRWRATPWEG